MRPLVDPLTGSFVIEGPDILLTLSGRFSMNQIPNCFFTDTSGDRFGPPTSATVEGVNVRLTFAQDPADALLLNFADQDPAIRGMQGQHVTTDDLTNNAPPPAELASATLFFNTRTLVLMFTQPVTWTGSNADTLLYDENGKSWGPDGDPTGSGTTEITIPLAFNNESGPGATCNIGSDNYTMTATGDPFPGIEGADLFTTPDTWAATAATINTGDAFLTLTFNRKCTSTPAGGGDILAQDSGGTQWKTSGDPITTEDNLTFIIPIGPSGDSGTPNVLNVPINWWTTDPTGIGSDELDDFPCPDA